MTTRTLIAITVVLTLLVLADTAWMLYRMAQGQPTGWWGMLLFIPWLWAMKKFTAAVQPSAGGSAADPAR